MNIELLLNRVLIDTEEAESKTSSGLIVTKNTDPGEMKTGVVVAVGEGKRSDTGDLIPMKLQVGDNVMFQYGTKVMIEGKSYVLAGEGGDVVMILK